MVKLGVTVRFRAGEEGALVEFLRSEHALTMMATPSRHGCRLVDGAYRCGWGGVVAVAEKGSLDRAWGHGDSCHT